MRRHRDLRDLKERILLERSVSSHFIKRKLKQKIKNRTKNSKNSENSKKNHIELSKKSFKKPIDLSFVPYKKYIPKRNYKIAHIIESLGLGGAQTQLFEMVNGFNKYCNNTINKVILLANKNNSLSKMVSSYDIKYDTVNSSGLKHYLMTEDFDVVFHYRISQSNCLRKNIPSKIKYILINTTINNLSKMSTFLYCDAYVSVCKSLLNQTRFPSVVEKTRVISILNGAENDFVQSVESIEKDGFITGRCQRFVPGKFKSDSLKWFVNTIVKDMPNCYHCLVGTNPEAKKISKTNKNIKYYGSISDRFKKVSILKSFDLYFYETFRHEGASMAVLESLACGVPVLCSDYGGNKELVIDGINGFICKDRNSFYNKIKHYYKHPNDLEILKKTTIEDFNNRLHIKNVCSKYVQLLDFLE